MIKECETSHFMFGFHPRQFSTTNQGHYKGNKKFASLVSKSTGDQTPTRAAKSSMGCNGSINPDFQDGSPSSNTLLMNRDKPITPTSVKKMNGA
jgi:hypothetical protein